MVKAVLTQFNEEDIEIQNISYVESVKDLQNIFAAARYNDSIIAYTIVIPSLKQYLDQEGVGKLVEMGVKLGRDTEKGLKTGICGEHGGEKNSI